MDSRPTPPANAETASPTSSQTSRKRLALGSAVILATALIGVPVVNAVASTGEGTKTLTNVVPGLSKLDDLGTVAADKPMLIGISIPGNTAARDAAYRAMTTPGSASYGYQYTPASYAAAFGVSSEVSQSVLSWATGSGLKSVYDAKDGSYLELTGTAAQVEKTLKVSVHNYQVNGKTYYASTTGATVPSSVGTVLGLSDFDKAHIDASQDICEAGQCTGTTAPPALWGNYDLPDSYTEGAALKPSEDYGQGQKVAIFGEGDLVQVIKDLRLFEDDTSVGGDVKDLKPKLPHIPVVENLVNDTQKDKAGLGEWDLDSQSSTGMSPDLAQLQFYFGEDLSDTAIAGTYSAWANDPNGAMIGNSSFGGCETLNLALGGASVDDLLLQQAAMMGRTMFVSTGDTGSGGCVPVLPINGVGNGGAPIVEYPASSPYVVGVGGTTDYTASTGSVQNQPPVRATEDTWDDSGGGSSEFEAQPQDQASLGGTLPAFLPCASDSSGNPSTGVTCRSIPDISAQSGDIATNNYGIESNGAQTAEAGTSLSSPLMAGMWARVRAAHSAGGCTSPTPLLAQASLTKAGLTAVAESTSSSGDIGFAQQALYDIAEKSADDDVASFFDIGGTTNSQPGRSIGTGNGAYTPLPRSAVDPTGFDFTSGLGAPDISMITLILDCSTTPTSTAVPDSDMVTINTPSAGGGGSGCPPNGTLTDTTGDELPPDNALDIVSVRDTSTPTVITFTETLAGLPDPDPAQENDYASNFTYQGVQYEVQADNGAPGDETTATYTLSSAVTDSNGVTTTTSLGTLNGSFDDATATVTVLLPYADFNTYAHPTKALVPGDTLTAMSVVTTTLATQTFDQADIATFSCGFSLAGDVTTPSPMPSTSSPSPSDTPSVTPTTSSPTPSDTSSSPSPSDTATPTTSSPTPSASVSPSTSPTPTVAATKTQAAPVPTFPTYPAPLPTATTAAPVAPATVTPATRFHPLSYSPLNSKTVVNGHDEAAKVVGVSGVPATNVVDVLLQVTVDQATANAPVLIDSNFGTAPAQQAAIATKGKTVRNVILISPDSQGLVRVEMTQGAARIALAVVGYDSLGGGDGFHPTFGGRVSATLTKVTTSKKPLAVAIGGKGGVPAGSLDAALLDARVSNVTLPRKVSSAILYATVGGTGKKTAIATITSKGTTTSLLVVRPDRRGNVTFSLSAGGAKIVVNEYGTWANAAYTAAHDSSNSLRFGHPMSALPEFTGTVGTGTKTISLSGLPATGVSTVILQVSVASGANAGEVALATTGARFGDGSLSYLPNQGSAQLVSVAPDRFGRVSLHLTKGSRTLRIALVGFTALS